MVVFFDFAAWVILVWQKAAFDRSRPDDSILLLICVLGRFDKEVADRALEYVADQLWSGDTIGDGAVGVYVPAVGGVTVQKTREAVVLHNADPSVQTSELPDHAHRDLG